MKECVEYTLVKLFLWFAKIMPKFVIYFMMKYFTLLVYFLDRNRRLLTIANLSMAYPEKTSKEIKNLSKTVYIELSKTISEILLMFVNRLDIDALVNNKDEAVQKLKGLNAQAPHGIIVMTAHFSNWELAAHFLAKHGLPMLAVGRKGNNGLIEKNITIPFREKYGNEAVSKDKAMLMMIRRLKNAGNVGLLIDQKAGKLNSAKIDFFGEPAETTLSIASLKLKLNALVIPIFIAREDDGSYKMIINEPIEYLGEEFKNKEQKIEAMTARYNQAIETVIQQYPAQWFWMHNRWRK